MYIYAVVIRSVKSIFDSLKNEILKILFHTLILNYFCSIVENKDEKFSNKLNYNSPIRKNQISR